MAKAIGPSFPDELKVAGLLGLPFAWGSDGEIHFDLRMTQAQRDAVQAVYAAHDPTKPAAPPSSPLTQALDVLLALPAPNAQQIVAALRVWRQGL